MTFVLIHFNGIPLNNLHQPRRKHAHRGYDERTKDIRAVYTRDEVTMNGETVEGKWCEICW